MSIRLLLFVSLVALASCRSSNFPELDWESWKQDKMGCNGNRAMLINELKSIKEEIKGRKMEDILKHLGNPDEKELVKRSKTYFRYFHSNHECSDNAENKFLQIRFNATERVDEIILLE